MSHTTTPNPLGLTMIPLSDGNTCWYNNEFVLADNFADTPHCMTSDAEIRPFIKPLRPFRLDFTMALFCCRGHMRVQVNLTEYELKENHMLITMSGDVGLCLDISDDCNIGLIAWNSDAYTHTSAATSGEMAITVRKRIVTSPLLELTPDDMDELLTIYTAMRRKMQQPDFRFKRQILMSYMQVLYCMCCQRVACTAADTGQEPAATRSVQLFDRFMELVKTYYATQRKIGFYADRLCVTPKYLSQVIYEVSGRHATYWIRSYVILQAKALLGSSQLTIQQIADQLHFANQSFFGSYFKKAVGCSPSAYRDCR